MTVGFVDTTVVIHIYRKNAAARTWVDSQSSRLSITPIAWMEVMDGVPNKMGQAMCKTILSEFDIVYLGVRDMEWAMQQLETYRLTHGVGMNDCLIASICHRLQVPLYTHNLKHMRVLLDPTLV